MSWLKLYLSSLRISTMNVFLLSLRDLTLTVGPARGVGSVGTSVVAIGFICFVLGKDFLFVKYLTGLNKNN